MPTDRARRARTAAARAFLAAAAAGWTVKLAGLANHQERLAVSAAAGAPPGTGGAGVLDRITVWAFLHDAAAFARWRADLDRGGLKKLWALAALEAGAIAAGALATRRDARRTLTVTAAALLSALSVADPPETVVEIIANHARLGVRLPSYRIAVVAGCVLGGVAMFGAALALAWDDDDGRGGGCDGWRRGCEGDGGTPAAGGGEAASTSVMDTDGTPSNSPPPLAPTDLEKGGSADPVPTSSPPPTPPRSALPSADDALALPYPPDPAARGLAPWQARLEALTLRLLDANRSGAIKGGWALCGVAWAITVAGVAVGAVRGGWWPTHIPLAALVAGAQGFALALGALDAAGPVAWIRGRAGLAALVALEAAAIGSVTRINRRWASTTTLFGFRVVGSTPTAPPGWFVFNGGAWAFVAVAASVVVAAGSAPRRPALDARPPRAAFQRCAAVAGIALATAGFFTCVATSVRTYLATGGGRSLPESALYSVDGDVSWLLYLAPLPAFMVMAPAAQATDLTHARTAAGCVLVSTGALVLYAYLLTPPLAFGNKVGLGLIVAGFLAVCVLGYLDSDGPTARVVVRAGEALARARARRAGRGRHDAGLFTAAGYAVSVGRDDNDDDEGRGISLLLRDEGEGQDGGGGGRGGGGGGGAPAAATAPAPTPPTPPPPPPPDLALEKLLGYGSFGAVYRGTFRGSRVAVKCLFAPTARAAAAARREAALGLSLRHPSVLATYAVVDAPMDAVAWPADLALPPGALAAAGSSSTATSAVSDRHRTRSSRRGASPPPAPPPRLVSIVMELADGGSLDRAIRLGRMAGPPAVASAATSKAGSRVGSRVPSRAGTPQLEAAPSLRAAAAAGGGGGGSGSGGGDSSSDLVTPRARLPVAPTDWPPTPVLPTTPSPARRTQLAQNAAAAPAAARPPPHAPTVLATLLDVAQGLVYLHSVGIAHGDVKPANILLRSSVAPDSAGRTFRALLADYGLSKSLLRGSDAGGGGGGGGGPGKTAGTPATLPGGVVGPDAARLTHYTASGHGTMAYAAPELLSLGRTGPAADVFAFSIVMAEIWMGSPPYGSVPPPAIYYAVVAEGRRPAPKGLPDAPPGYVALMQACWAAQPPARPPATVVVRWLKEMLDGAVAAVCPSPCPSPLLSPAPPPPPPPPPPQARVIGGSGGGMQVSTPSLGDIIAAGAGAGRGSSGWRTTDSGGRSSGGRGSGGSGGDVGRGG